MFLNIQLKSINSIFFYSLRQKKKLSFLRLIQKIKSNLFLLKTSCVFYYYYFFYIKNNFYVFSLLYYIINKFNSIRAKFISHLVLILNINIKVNKPNQHTFINNNNNKNNNKITKTMLKVNYLIFLLFDGHVRFISAC